MMKKIVPFLLMILVVTGCGANTKNGDNSGNAVASDANKVYTIHLTKAEFLRKIINYEENPSEWKYLGDKPAIVDFYASWCGPCKIVAPILEELAAEYKDDIYIYKIDTDKEGELSAAFGISSIPTMFFIPMGGNPQVVQGALPREELKKIIENTLLKKKL